MRSNKTITINMFASAKRIPARRLIGRVAEAGNKAGSSKVGS